MTVQLDILNFRQKKWFSENGQVQHLQAYFPSILAAVLSSSHGVNHPKIRIHYLMPRITYLSTKSIKLHTTNQERRAIHV